MAESFWERPEVVARFVNREVDHRLKQLLTTQVTASWRVLDIGCAAGRNTIYLAEQGLDVYALDASQAMVLKTRERLQAFMTEAEAEKRVIHGHMESLTMFENVSFDLIVALGVYQDADSFDIWQQAIKESARVLKTGGFCLVAQFAPDHQPHGKIAQPVPGETHVYSGASRDDSRRTTLLYATDMDEAFSSVGLFPLVPTDHVRRNTEKGYRSTVNALYQKN